MVNLNWAWQAELMPKRVVVDLREFEPEYTQDELHEMWAKKQQARAEQ